MGGKLSLVFLTLTISTLSANADCQRYRAPHNFPNTPLSWGEDTGPIVSAGFVDSGRTKGGIYKVVHGIDVAKGDEVDYSKFAKCGGEFALVRINHSITKAGQIAGPIDEQFSSHMEEFAKHGVVGIPYFYFSLPKSFKQLTALNKRLSDSELDAERTKYAEFGRKAGKAFIQYVGQLSATSDVAPLRRINIAGLRAKFIALDVEEVPIGAQSAASTNVSRRNYGRLYAAAVCQWITTVRDKYPDLVPLLYTFPAIYGEYLQYALPSDNACLQGLPVWISRTYRDGWEAIRSADPNDCAESNKKRNNAICTTDRFVKLTCKVQSGNRCIIHQYTHRATDLAMGRKKKKRYPPHFDLNRFYASRISRTNSSPQYVRVEAW